VDGDSDLAVLVFEPLQVTNEMTRLTMTFFRSLKPNGLIRNGTHIE